MKPTIQRHIPKEEFLSSLEASIVKSFSRLEDRKASVLFSGGVDSSLAAVLTDKYAEETLLLTAAADGSHDDRIASRSAKELSFELVKIPLSLDVVWEALPQVIRTIQTSNKMDVEIALPFYLASKAAKANGFPLMISGQGPDELFAGYARYVRIFQKKGEKELERYLWEDVSKTEEVNINRDKSAIEAFELQACFPYLYPEFVSIAMSIPARYKITSGGTPERKVIFRELAMSLGLPERIAMQPKKATQFSSGSCSIIAEAIAMHSNEAVRCSTKELTAKVQPILRKMGLEMGVSKEN